MKGYAIAASDGRIGTVSDFLFDDTNWQIRWLVVETGDWLSRRKVLLTPVMLGQLDPKGHAFTVDLTMQQVKDSPDVDTDLPVSRQIESDIYNYYGWNPYWGNGAFTDSYGYVGATWTEAPTQETLLLDKNMSDTQKSADDPHLRSIETVTGYNIHASDGEIGHVEDFLLEDTDWRIRYLVIDTKNWWPGKHVIISPQSVRKIDWQAKVVSIGQNRKTIMDSPAYDASTMIDAAYDDAFLTYYGLRLVPA
jgi:sporulation protein YlmC with PRC-barrel domain